MTIAVSDDGAGIPSAALNRVFEPHFSTRTTGSGLGLAISVVFSSPGEERSISRASEGRGAKVVISMQAANVMIAPRRTPVEPRKAAAFRRTLRVGSCLPDGRGEVKDFSVTSGITSRSPMDSDDLFRW